MNNIEVNSMLGLTSLIWYPILAVGVLVLFGILKAILTPEDSSYWGEWESHHRRNDRSWGISHGR